MRNKFIPVLVIGTIFFVCACKTNKKNSVPALDKNIPGANMPFPEEGEENHKLRELYNELRHRTAPGTSWQEIENQNARQAWARKMSGLNSPQLAFANNNIFGTWSEKGAQNLAGSVRAVDYIANTNTIYTISNGGSIWSSVLGSGTLILRSQSLIFEPRAIKAFTKTAGR